MLKEAFRVLQKNGTAAFSVWGRKENSSQFTYLSQITEPMGVSLAFGTPTRSPFHLGVNLENLRKRAIQAGFSRAVTFYQFHPMPSMSPAEITTKMLAPPSTALALSKLDPKQQEEIKAKSTQFVEACLQRNEPLSMEALILVVSKD
eukprot:Phypoly_transcript_11897.p1 GENE.Phypoly_transcript_11897~~Phypoly_transcript_11897.p1  ORF type:complete len:147 (+),score=30.78 Phypoly_transcript_11897:724-1164(+)